MSTLTKNDVLQMAIDEDVEFIRLQFTDVKGMIRNIAMTVSQLEYVLDNGCVFDISAVDGIARPDGSDRILIPDPSSFTIFPWRPQNGKVARLVCDVLLPNGAPAEGDVRRVLKRAIEHAEAEGLKFEVGANCEFFLFDTDENGNATTNTNEQAGYFDVFPLDGGENARRDIVMTLEDMGIEVLSSHHELAPAQHEIDLGACDVLEMADRIQTFKLVVRTLARRHGLHATFMPKPKADVAGSGMHLNFALYRDGSNIFSDSSDPNGLSQEGYWFIGGLMKHLPAMAAVTNPLVNSYKRLVPYFDAPTYVAWSTTNRNQMIRIPTKLQGWNERIELRNPDSSANPYLALAMIIEAGLDGIRNKIMPPAAVDTNIDLMSDEERAALGLVRLPVTLGVAIEEFEKDAVMTECLGKYLAPSYIKLKTEEWIDYVQQVSAWETDHYLLRY